MVPAPKSTHKCRVVGTRARACARSKRRSAHIATDEAEETFCTGKVKLFTLYIYYSRDSLWCSCVLPTFLYS